MAKLAFLLVVTLAFAGPTFLHSDDTPLATQEFIDQINANGTWTASMDWTQDKTIGDAKQLMGTFITPSKLPVNDFGALLDHVRLPDHFDSSAEWPKCEHKILNQGQCGSCWAFGSSEALSTRFCVATHKHKDPVMVTLSPQYLVSCDEKNQGCNGGWLDAAWEYLHDHGIPTLQCDPYTSGTTQENGRCSTHCKNGNGKMKFYRAAKIFALDTPKKIKAAILTGGPVESAFTVYKDFMSYKSGVYIQHSNVEMGGHAIKIIGWGKTDKGVDYFIVDNSWGADWGMNGRFWIQVDQCGIGKQGYAGDPDLSKL